MIDIRLLRDDFAAVAEALRRIAPRIPPHEFEAVCDHARTSRGLRGASPQGAAWLSLVSYVRHGFTDYDRLLADGYDVDSARFFTAGEIDAKLEEWGAVRRVGEEE